MTKITLIQKIQKKKNTKNKMLEQRWLSHHSTKMGVPRPVDLVVNGRLIKGYKE